MSIAVIPQPQHLTLGEGHFIIDAATRLIVPAPAKAAGEYLANWLRKATGFAIPVETNPVDSANAIRFHISPSDEYGAEGYYLRVTSSFIEIEASDPAGLFYGVQTLRQLLPAELETQRVRENAFRVPAVDIRDYPRFEWRGLLLDVGRHFFSVSFIKKLLDAMALYKLNRLQLHLTDDQGWRIEVKSFPLLTETGSKRSASPIPERREKANTGPYFSNLTDGIPYGGFFTQDDIREIVSHAQTNFIVVVPEIEMPGHSVAALASYPYLGCVGSGYEVRTTWGIAEDVLCVGKESTYVYVDKVLSEIAELFPSEYIHIGGDECPKIRWQHCPHCQDIIEREGLKDEYELQSYFIRRVEKILEAHGRRLIGWDEILEGGLAPTATVMSWRGAKGGIEAATAGHHVIMSPNTHCYLDYYQSDDTLSEPPAIKGLITFNRAYEFDPTEGVPADKTGFVLGGQGNLWTEYVDTEPHAEYMIFPRALALADAFWTVPPRSGFKEFFSRAEIHFPRLEHLGIHYRKPLDAEKP